MMDVFVAAVTGLAAAGLSLLIEFSIRVGNIFEGWLPFVARLLIGRFGRQAVRHQHATGWLDQAVPIGDHFVEYAAKRYSLMKPLGLCVHCMNVWVSLAGFGFAAGVADLSWWMLPVHLGVSVYAVRVVFHFGE